ncbi:transketolase [Cetobacterium sp. 2A]|nr:transketolase [Cetobacterium sp. 2A]
MEVLQVEKECKRIRREILEMIHTAGSGHPGGSLSGVELLYVLYSEFLKYDSNNPKLENRDRVIISKGHASALVYSILSEFGFFPKKELKNFRKLHSLLQGHVYREVPGVELSTGSLGQGLSYSCGVAMAGVLNKKDYKTFCYLGDGELQEGNVWEAAMTAGFRKLNNLCAIVDYNKVQENGLVREIKSLEPLRKKFEDFGWSTVEINGHDISEIKMAFNKFLKETEKPFVIIANTIKGKGVSFMEMNSLWHGKAPNDVELQKALEEIGG